jgi:DNA-binding MarR family transcriptional regulator
MVSALLGDRAVPAGELAREAGVSASTASEHLRVLLDAKIVAVEHRGRNRLFRLADGDVSRAIEALQAIAPRREIRSLRQHRASELLRAGRTCYDHLAGDLGLRVSDLLISTGVVAELKSGLVSSPPQPFPQGLVVETLDLRPPQGTRPWARGCLDWTGRRAHVAGQIGAQILATMESRGWISRRPNTRAVLLTEQGARQLEALEAEALRRG